MIETLLLLAILGASVVTLPRHERATGAIAATATLVTATVLAFTEAGLAIGAGRWLFAIALALSILNPLLGAAAVDVRKHNWEELR